MGLTEYINNRIETGEYNNNYPEHVDKESIQVDDGNLENISGVNTSKAEALRKAGYESADDLRAASHDELSDVSEIGNALAARIKADRPEEPDVSVPINEYYPDWTLIPVLLTTIISGTVLWLTLIIGVGDISIDQILAGSIPFSELFFDHYLEFSAAFGVGTSLSGSYWYIHKAPPSIRDELNGDIVRSFLGGAIINTIILILIFLLVGNLTLVVDLLTVVLVLVLPGVGILVGLLTANVRMIGASILLLFTVGVFVVTAENPSNGLTYVFVIIAILALPYTRIPEAVHSHRQKLGELRTAHSFLERDKARLHSESPSGYNIEFTLPDIRDGEDLATAEQTAIEAFDLVEAYEKHIEINKKIDTYDDSNMKEVLLLLLALTHPSRCKTPSASKQGVNSLTRLFGICKQESPELLDAVESPNVQIMKVCKEIEQSKKTDSNDIKRIEKAVDTFENRLSKIQKETQFRNRINTVQSELSTIFGSPVELNIEPKPVTSHKRAEIEHYEELLPIARRAQTLHSEYPDADLPEAVLEKLRADAIDADDLEPYELLIEATERALEATDDHGPPFDQARSQVLQIAQAAPAMQSDDLEALREVLVRGPRIAEFLDTVDHDHPSVEAAEWRDALDAAAADAFPNVLRPIDNRIEAMNDGMWERSDLYAYNWQEFESLVGSLYSDEGYEVEVTADTNDEGVDVWARSPSETVAIQVKQNSQGNTVGRRVLQQLASTIAKGSADRVVVVTSAGFADTAVEYATEFGPEMDLIDGEDLVRKLSASDLPPP